MMIPCQRCMQQLATRTLVNPMGVPVQLCEMCAMQVSGGPPVMPKMLLPVLMGETRPASQACPSCHTTLRQLQTASLLGCPECYRFFREALLATVHRLHGAHQHRGRRPARERPEQLRALLEAAVAEERFEEAAQLRDRLRALQPPREERDDS